MMYRIVMASMFLVFFAHLPTPARAESGLDLMRKVEAVFTRIADRVKPAVVSIRSERKGDAAQKALPTPHPQIPRYSSGSGVIIDPEGYILTNNHVVSDADRLRVRLADESIYWAKVIGTDRYTDLALIKIQPQRPLPAATLGDSDKVRVGQWSIAVGDPFGIARTFTVGVVSGIGRTNVGVARYEYFIQTDAAINRGNSGGPLVNIEGDVIGINTAIRTPGSGIGFAIPVNMAKDVIRYLRRIGNFPRGYLGVSIQQVSPDMTYILGLRKPRGALVGSLLKDGPAEGAGIQAGDVIVRLNGATIADMSHLQRLVGWTAPGEAVTVEVVRNAQRKRFSVKLARLPDRGQAARQTPKNERRPPEEDKYYGVDLENLTDALRKKSKLQARSGVYVHAVRVGSRAFADGLRKGMVISELTYRPPGGRMPVRVEIKKLEDVERLLKQIPAGANVLARIARGTDRGERTSFAVLHGFRR